MRDKERKTKTKNKKKLIMTKLTKTNKEIFIKQKINK